MSSLIVDFVYVFWPLAAHLVVVAVATAILTGSYSLMTHLSRCLFFESCLSLFSRRVGAVVAAVVNVSMWSMLA
jgi:hypothetical protein